MALSGSMITMICLFVLGVFVFSYGIIRASEFDGLFVTPYTLFGGVATVEAIDSPAEPKSTGTTTVEPL